ncbi:MAG: hypothetical protein ABMA25_06840 [Ilumatobacteraceae bacterium]
MPAPSDYFDQFRDQLAALGAQPVGIGAFAALLYRAEPRETTDVDFLVTSLHGVAEAFREFGYDVRAISEPDSDQPYVVFVRGGGAKMDALLVETDYHAEAHRRAVSGMLTVEDVLVHKLIAWRAKDQDDIASILSTSPTLDESYIDRWAEEWQVGDRWSEARTRWGRR